MSESLQRETVNIMDMCKQVLQTQKISSNQYNISQLKKRNKSKQIMLNAMNSKLSPSQQSQNNKIIQKLRRKYNKKKQVKQIVIRKTDLGENQMIFTKDELQKLKEIDDDQMFGYSSLKQNLNLTLNENTQTEKQQQVAKKYFFNPSFDKPKEEIQKYLDWVNLNEFKGSKDKNKNKIINFQKRQNSSTPNLLIGNKKSKFPLLNSSPKNTSSFAKPKNLKIQNANKTSPLMKKNSVDKGFLNSINSNDGLNLKKLTKEQKMHEIVDKVNDKIEKKLSSSASQKMFIYMTEERKQALFECQVLRKIKRQIGQNFFNNLHITYGTKVKTDQNKDGEIEQYKQNNQNQKGLRKTSYGQVSKSYSKGSNKQRGFGQLKQKDSEMQAQRMIQKNINRLKQERKRVIQKITC